MSARETRLKSTVGSWKLNWKSVPRGREGVVEVEATQAEGLHFAGEVRWRRDGDGIWIQFPHGLFGFDLKAHRGEEGEVVYSISQRRAFGEWEGVSAFMGDEGRRTQNPIQKIQAIRVRAQMPGKILRVLVQPNQEVQKNQPVVVMEAMKMENEIRAPQAGQVSLIQVVEGQVVETGADLLLIDNRTK